MSEARERLERALARLEAAAARPKSTARPADNDVLTHRCASLESAAREAIIRIDRLLDEDAA